MNDKQKKVILVIGLAVAAYLGYRWYVNRQSNGPTGLGTNLNSLPSALVGGSTGPQSGLNYYAGATTIYVTEPVTQNSKGSTVSNQPPKPHGIPPGVNPGGPMRWFGAGGRV